METRDVTATEDAPTGLGGWNPIPGLPLWGVPAFFAAAAAFAAVLSALVPAFYARVVWQYYWGPIRADALGVPFAVHEGVLAFPGFNLVNTVSWIVLTLLIVLWSLQIIQRYRIKRNDAFVLSCAFGISAGAIAHVLQDTGLFARPLEYFFITPIVFVGYFLVGLGHILWGVLAARVAERHGVRRGVLVASALPVALAGAWLLLHVTAARLIVAWVHPVVPVALAALTVALVAWHARRRGRIDPSAFMGFAFVPWFGLAVAFVLKWAFIAEWGDLPSRGVDAALPWALVIAPVATAAVVAAGAGVAWVALRKRDRALRAACLTPLGLVVAVSQVGDGLVTALGMDLRGYTEKHVLPRFLIEKVGAWGDATGLAVAADYPAFLVFPALKLLVAAGLVAFAVALFGNPPRDADHDRDYAPWHLGIMIAVIIIGLGPAVRNLVRLTLGV